MSASGDPAPDPGHDEAARDRARHAPGRSGRAHLHALGLDPTLGRLADDGWRLDRLPTTGLALAFVAALLVTLLTFGPLATAPVLLTTTASAWLAVTALGAGDAAAARLVLRAACAVLLVWTAFCACTGG